MGEWDCDGEALALRGEEGEALPLGVALPLPPEGLREAEAWGEALPALPVVAVGVGVLSSECVGAEVPVESPEVLSEGRRDGVEGAVGVGVGVVPARSEAVGGGEAVAPGPCEGEDEGEEAVLWVRKGEREALGQGEEVGVVPPCREGERGGLRERVADTLGQEEEVGVEAFAAGPEGVGRLDRVAMGEAEEVPLWRPLAVEFNQGEGEEVALTPPPMDAVEDAVGARGELVEEEEGSAVPVGGAPLALVEGEGPKGVIEVEGH